MSRLSARSEATTAVDNKKQVSGVGRMKVETLILHPSFDLIESRIKLSTKSRKAQNRAK